MRLIILIFLLGCGDSPFINKETSGEVRGIPGLENELVFPSQKVILKTYWNKGPIVSDESKLTIILLDEYGRTIDPPLKLNILLWMPTMGHGSFPVKVKKLSQGVYEAQEIFFTMEGYWDIHFQLMENNKVQDEVKWGLEL
ncbi:MAG: hypothetical protein DRQ88_08865 [Epsilonproteobacteria bacterium]|nr:MAG: hypothetical protein DRQ89_08860 [Campylobacterota bacterium]RLA65693.1 MAG: hypothetical protein DRQ88_08865 [Campylobacterota bacterium]